MRRNTVLLGLRDRLPQLNAPDSDPFRALPAGTKFKPSIALFGREGLGNYCRQTQSGWLELGCVSTINSNGQTIFVVDAHRDDGRRFIMHFDEKLTAFPKLEGAVCIHLLSE
jgi:hypothetical protein